MVQGPVDELGRSPPPNAARTAARLGDRLVAAGVLDDDRLRRAVETQKREGGWFGDVVLRLGLCKEEELLRVLAADYKTRYVVAEKLSAFRIAQRTLDKIPIGFASKLWLVPLAFDDQSRSLHVVAAVPPDAATREDLLAATDARDLVVYVATRLAVESLIKKHYRSDPYAFAWLDEPVREPPAAEQTTRYEEAKQADTSTTRRELAKLQLASEFRRRVAGERDPAQLPARMLAVLLDLFPADGGAVLVHKGPSVRRSRVPGRQVEVSRTVLAEVAASGDQGVLFGDVERDPRTKKEDSLVIRSVKSAMAAPLRGPEGVIGVLYLEATRPTLTFGREELEQLLEVAKLAVEAFALCEEFAAVHREAASRIHLGRFLSPTLVDQAARGGLDVLEAGVRRQATVLVVGIAGLARLAAADRSPIEVFRTVNELLEHIADAVQEEGGSLDRLGARGVSAVFGLPVRHPDDAPRALLCATRIAEEATRLLAAGGPRLGVGVHRGELLFGGLGPERRRDLTAFGPAVDVASRLGYAASPGEILVTRATAELASDLFAFAPRALPQRPEEPALEVVRLAAIKG